MFRKLLAAFMQLTGMDHVHRTQKRWRIKRITRSARGYPQTEAQNLLNLFLTTYDWPSPSFSLLSSACFFFSGPYCDVCLAPSNASAREDLARIAAATATCDLVSLLFRCALEKWKDELKDQHLLFSAVCL